MLLETSLTQSQKQALKQVCNSLDIRTDWLIAIMYLESGLNPQAVNPSSNATGLIQFMPATAQGLGTSTSALYNMTFEQQMIYVERYYAPYKKSLSSLYQLYLTTFYPAALRYDDSFVFPNNVVYANQVLFKYGNTKYAWKKFLKEYFMTKFPSNEIQLFYLPRPSTADTMITILIVLFFAGAILYMEYGKKL